MRVSFDNHNSFEIWVANYNKPINVSGAIKNHTFTTGWFNKTESRGAQETEEEDFQTH